MRQAYFILLLSLTGILLLSACKSRKSPKANGHTTANHLIHEASPYLLQHAHNPVDWYPWGEAALDRAKKENKLLLISVGYAACHWCHVMEAESFEDSLVAAVMNERFISIKVDREERPDIDDIYMSACQMISERGCGWPLNAFALPDGRPIFAGTYYPRDQWIKVLNQVADFYQNEPAEAEEIAGSIVNNIALLEAVPMVQEAVSHASEDLESITQKLLSTMDMQKGGRKGAPKFPGPNQLEFLLRHHAYTGDSLSLKAVTVTLEKMAMGGIFDQIGGGFARYSTDPDWKVPHFEKMLYDNAQLVSLYSHAWQLRREAEYERVVTSTLDFIARELTGKSGGFYSSLDADSEGEEGKFYVWTEAEIDELLGEEAAVFKTAYSVRSGGNWEHGQNILYRQETDSRLAKELGMTETSLRQSLSGSGKKLLKARGSRVRPGLDDKVITAWNGLMIRGYADAYRAFGKQEYLDAALRNARFLKENAMQSDYRLNRITKDGKSSINGFLDDYAQTIEAFIALYQATFDEVWLMDAEKLAEYAIAHFHDPKSGMFFYTSDLDDPLITRKLETADNVIPASTSSLANGLFVLGTYLYRDDFLSYADQMLRNLKGPLMGAYPQSYTNWALLLDRQVHTPYEVAIVGKDFESLRRELDAQFLPDLLLLGGKDEGTLELLKYKLIAGQTTIYVCQNKLCKMPVTETGKALKLMGR